METLNLKTGSTWWTRSGRAAVVVRRSDGFCWIVQCENDTWSCDDSGKSITSDPEDDLISRYNHITSASTDTKASNPKEAIGDKKVPLWLCSPIAEAHWSAAQFSGLAKYGAWNWRAAGVRTSTYLSAIKRHHARYANGERLDPVDGTHHLGNIMACAAILLEAEYLGKLNDDRAPSADLQRVFDEVEATIARLKEKYADKDPKHWTIHDEVTIVVDTNDEFPFSRLVAAANRVIDNRGLHGLQKVLLQRTGSLEPLGVKPEDRKEVTLWLESLDTKP